MKRLKQLAIAILATGMITVSAFAADQTTTTTTNPNTTTQPTAQTSTSGQSSFTPTQIEQLQKIIHDYIVKNPQVLVEASQALQQQQMVKAESAAMQAITQNKQKIFDDANNPTAGNPNGTVTLVEFFDYQCGHCKAMNPVIQSLIKKNSNLKVIFKELPIFGGNSKFAAQAALASQKQGDFYFKFHDALLAAGNPLNKVKILAIAKKVGLNVTKLKKDMDSKAVQTQLRNNFELAQALKLMGTPAFIMANKAQTQFKFIPGATNLDTLQKNVTQLEGGTASSNTTTNTQ